jgi:pimeloyl-ACP methyl ester carboxylesterase
MPYAHVNDIDLYYEQQGDGEPLALLHNFTGYGGIWERVVPRFCDRYRVIVPDLRGHGRSTGTLETIHHRNFAADIVALLDTLAVASAHFVGHSSGAMCLLFVGTQCQDRVRTLVLSGATYTLDEHAKAVMRQRVVDAPPPDDAGLARWRHDHGAVHGEEHWKVLREAFRVFTVDPEELPFKPADLAIITRPVLIVHGDRDELFPIGIPVDLYRAMPNAELAIFPNTGHHPPFEREEMFVTLIGDFLDRKARD